MSGRILLALAWLQWRLALNAVKGGASRGGLERLSRLAAAITPVLLAILILPAMVAIAVAGAFGGWALATRPDAVAAVVFIVGIVLLASTAWALIRPFALATQGQIERGELLRLLPIPGSVLRNLELVRAIMDPLFIVFVPGVLALAPGALFAGRPFVAVVALVGGIGFLAVLVCLTSVLSLASQLVLRDRRRGELVALIFILVFSALAFLPQYWRLNEASSRPEPAPAAAEKPSRSRGGGPPELAEMPRALRVLPSFQLGQALAASARGEFAASILPLGTLWVIAALGYGLVVPLHRRLVETPASSGAGREERIAAGLFEIPLASAPVAAIASVQIRTFLRTVRGKVTLAFPPLMGVLIAFLVTRGSVSDMPVFLTSATWAPAFVALMAVFNLGVLTANQFAISGSGLVLEFLQPVGARAMVRGRALAAALMCTASLFAALAPLLVVLPLDALPIGLALIPAGIAVHLMLAPVSAVLSAAFPKTANLARLGQEGQPHPVAQLTTFALLGLAAALPAGGILVAIRVLDRPWLAPLLTLIALALAGLLALATFPLAERALVARRENLALVAVGR